MCGDLNHAHHSLTSCFWNLVQSLLLSYAQGRLPSLFHGGKKERLLWTSEQSWQVTGLSSTSALTLLSFHGHGNSLLSHTRQHGSAWIICFFIEHLIHGNIGQDRKISSLLLGFKLVSSQKNKTETCLGSKPPRQNKSHQAWEVDLRLLKLNSAKGPKETSLRNEEPMHRDQRSGR